MATVIVIDEQKHLLEYLRGSLQRRGLDVHTAEESEAGWALAHALAPELLVVDERMLRPDGSSLAEALRSSVALAGSRVITIRPRGSRPEADVTDRAVTLPFRPSELVALITTESESQAT